MGAGVFAVPVAWPDRLPSGADSAAHVGYAGRNAGADMADDLADERWTVRGVPKAYRDRATEAATRRKVTLGVYVCRALDLALQAEREPVDLIGAWCGADDAADVSAALSDASARVAMIERAVSAAVALAAQPEVPPGLRRKANRLLRESLAQASPRVSPGRRLLGAHAVGPSPSNNV